jgi:Lrp/AsnC family transcriptional regulator for asnA, asnC and gidA
MTKRTIKPRFAIQVFIRILCKDARTPFSKIGRILGVGTDTVFRRFNKLKQEGKVLGSTVILSSKVIGIKGWCGFLIKVKQGASVLIIREELTKQTQIYFLTRIMGDFDFYLEVGFRDFEELGDFVASLRKIKEILVIDPMMHASHAWPLPTLPTLKPEVLD